MNVHHFARELLEHEHAALSLGYKRLRSVIPKLNDTTNVVTSTTANGDFDIKSFIRADCGTKTSFIDRKKNTSQVEITPGGTRWNPTQEQIGILEMLYRGGLKTPNTQEIEQITAQLRKFGKIEGKNVFYWFQNHKARERQRQRQKHNSLSPSPSPRATTSTTTTIITSNTKGEEEKEEDSPYKRKCMTWTFKCSEENESFCNANGDGTLELFPLHPEGR